MSEEVEGVEFGFELWDTIAQRRRGYIADMVLNSTAVSAPDEVLTLCTCLDEWISNGHKPSAAKDGKIIPMKRP